MQASRLYSKIIAVCSSSVVYYWLVFGTGFAVGVLLAVSLLSWDLGSNSLRVAGDDLAVSGRNYGDWLLGRGLGRHPSDLEQLSYGRRDVSRPMLESAMLYGSVSLLCAVFLDEGNSADWATRCNGHQLFGAHSDTHYRVTRLPRTGSASCRLCHALHHLWRQHQHRLQWAMLAADSVYVIPENLRYLLAGSDAERARYLGDVSTYRRWTYNNAEAGVVLSRGAVRLYVASFRHDECYLSQDPGGRAGYALGRQLASLEVRAEDTRDASGRGRFHAQSLAQLIGPAVPRSSMPAPTSVTFRNWPTLDRRAFLDYVLYRLQCFRHACTIGNAAVNRSSEAGDWKRFIGGDVGPGAHLDRLSDADFRILWYWRITRTLDDGRRRRSSGVWTWLARRWTGLWSAPGGHNQQADLQRIRSTLA